MFSVAYEKHIVFVMLLDFILLQGSWEDLVTRVLQRDSKAFVRIMDILILGRSSFGVGRCGRRFL